MPAVSDEYREAMRQRIIDGAMAAFIRHGMHGASMAEIIAETGLSAGALYGYFRSKSDLTVAVAQEIIGGRIETIGALAAQTPVPSPADGLTQVVSGVPDAVLDSGLVLQVWSSVGTSPELRAMAAATIGRFDTEMARYAAAWYRQETGASPRAARTWATRVAPVLLATAQGYLIRRVLTPGLSPAKFFASLDALAAGVTAPAPAGSSAAGGSAS